ncbi:MAG: hypothetical protein D6B27_01135 [Gammaproteobacteria bacterium]|nr:MAG: hypothetical protein D6B27_01135 [Gammaproteobacteria bacterium]
MVMPTTVIKDRHRFRLLSLLLSIFHLSVWYSPSGKIILPLMLMHLGLFLFWQPFWNRKQEINPVIAVLFFGVISFALTIAPLWFLILWAALLIGFLESGSETGKGKLIYLFSIIFLISEIIFFVAPRLFNIDIFPKEWQFALFTIPFLITAPMLLVSSDEKLIKTNHFDIFRGLFFSFGVVVLVFGAVLRHKLFSTEYIDSLLQGFLIIGITLLLVGWIWNPGLGYKGLFFIWNSYLKKVEIPIEKFLLDLTESAKIIAEPDDFLSSALNILLQQEWLDGVQWRSASCNGELGECCGSELKLNHGDLRLKLYSSRPIGASLLIHAKLLVHILAYFYISKEREKKLSQKAHMEAIYQTGSRLTHDIKNMLQSLNSLTGIIEQSKKDDAEDVLALVRRQLPAINERLSSTIDKMSAPHLEKTTQIAVHDWWQSLQDRNIGRRITFTDNCIVDAMVIRELFDTVADNLLDNARVKRLQQKDIDIEIEIRSSRENISLFVIDTGWEVPEKISNLLFNETIESASGMGIGLYQSAKQAENNGYKLRLDDNRNGFVCFVLEPDL